jgi:acyl transferase domain-containing protein
MAARFTTEEVLEKLFCESDDEGSEIINSSDLEDEEDNEKEDLVNWIGTFEGKQGFDSKFFQESALEVLLPIVRLASSLNAIGVEETQKSKGECSFF